MITLCEVNGRRWYQENSKLLPSASSVLDILYPSAIGYIPEDALARGSSCHAIAAAHLVAIANGTARPNTKAEEEDCMRAQVAVEYVQETVLEIVAVESPITFMGIGMTPDLVGVKHNGKIIVFDHKFAEQVSERYWFQLELYCRAHGADEGCLIQITRKGEIRIHKVELTDERWMLLRSAINVRKHLDNKEKRVS